MTAPKTIIGGDDVRGAVLDCGSWAIRFGPAGDDTPKVIFPSVVATRHSNSNNQQQTINTDVQMTDVQQQDKPQQKSSASSSKQNPSFIAGDIILSAPHSFQDVQSVYSFDNPTKPADVNNWDAMETIWKSAFSTTLLDSTKTPLMIIEPARTWTDSTRASALERAFESLNAPAVFLARGSATTAFASARTTACVLDIGYQSASAIPIVDGYPLQKSIVSTIAGGRYLNQQLYTWAQNCLAQNHSLDPNINLQNQPQFLRAPHEIQKKRNHSKDILGDKDEVVKRHYDVIDLSMKEPWTNCSDAHRAFYRMRLIEEMKMATLTVSQIALQTEKKQSSANDESKELEDVKNLQDGNNSSNNKKDANNDKLEKEPKSKDKSQTNSRSQEYTLPDGNILSLAQNDGINISECLFMNKPKENLQPLSDMVLKAVSNCDVDIRRDLFSGIVISGGTSMIPGVVERVTKELAIGIPQAYKLKVSASPNSIERTCGSWIGGSILSSLGTFQQAWISKREYDELGSMGALRKCP